MTIDLTYSSLREAVERSLSIIGKRSVDDKGNLLYKDITLGTNEKPIIDDYLEQAVIDITAETAAFITGSTGNVITLTFPSNSNEGIFDFIEKACQAYCVSFALHAWLSITAPAIAQRYANDCLRQISAIKRMIHEKKPPVSESSSPSYAKDVSTTVESASADDPQQQDTATEEPEEPNG